MSTKLRHNDLRPQGQRLDGTGYFRKIGRAIMKTSYLVNRSARVILGFIVLLGIGFVSSANGQRNRNWDGYPNWGGSYDLRQTALNAGYNEGSKEGRNDRDRNRHNDYSSFTAYQKATK